MLDDFLIRSLLAGVLIRRAWYFPTFLGVLIGVAGLGYLADGLMYFLLPDVAPATSPSTIRSASGIIGMSSGSAWHRS